MTKRFYYIIIALLLSLNASAQSVFDSYLENAKAFAEAFPREKVHLHFDNTSYFQGDTIWFKAYVVTSDDNKFSRISRPLYVELVDQLGNILERQIVKLNDGQGEGQISLSNTFFTGYFEIRAYTKWMLAFSDDEYFSRTLPIYRKATSKDAGRQIADYRMDESMQQRPTEKLKTLNVNFYPEGGNLVKGVQSVVGFEVISKDSGYVNIQGVLVDSDGKQLMPVTSIHDGMGTFPYIPGEKPASLEFNYNGKKHTFKLPKADEKGFNIRAVVRDAAFDVTVSRSEKTEARQLALFIFNRGVPYNYVNVDLSTSLSKRVHIPTTDIPVGVFRLALIDEGGNVLNDRFCFSYPDATDSASLAMKAETKQAVYAPYNPINCRLKVTDSKGNPVIGAPVSLSISDGIESDFRENENDIYTDLLLTSELKGYINRPEFYFAERNSTRRKMLDNLMIIRGWRHYELSEAFGVKEFNPQYLPEDKLTLYGKVKSYFQKSDNLDVTILAKRGDDNIMGMTKTDSIGQFSVPLDDFQGKLEALVQTRKAGKKLNRASTVSFDRRFQPSTRAYDVIETSPDWDSPVDTLMLNDMLLEADPWLAEEEDTQVLDELVVKAKHINSRIQDTQKFERSILGFYNMRQIIDDKRDEGAIINNDIGNLMHEINPLINFAGTYYKADSIAYSIEGHAIKREFVDGYIDEIETAVLYLDPIGTRVARFDADGLAVDYAEEDDYWTHTDKKAQEENVMNGGLEMKMLVRLDFIMAERFNPNKSYMPPRGIRRTLIQGYNKPEAFYSPQYPDGAFDVFDDRRRTIYWAPTLLTDENGDINIDCYNSYNTTYLHISAETLVDGQPAALNVNSIETSPGKATLEVTIP